MKSGATEAPFVHELQDLSIAPVVTPLWPFNSYFTTLTKKRCSDSLKVLPKDKHGVNVLLNLALDAI